MICLLLPKLTSTVIPLLHSLTLLTLWLTIITCAWWWWGLFRFVFTNLGHVKLLDGTGFFLVEPKYNHRPSPPYGEVEESVTSV